MRDLQARQVGVNVQFTGEEIEEIAEEYEGWLYRLDNVTTAFMARSYRSEKGREYANHGVGRRLQMLEHTSARIFELLPPEIEDPDRDALMDATAFLQAFMINVYGAIDNLAHIWCAELPVTNNAGRQLRRTEIGLRPKQAAVRNSLPPDFREYLIQCEKWFDYLEGYRDALAHRVPLYIPRRQLQPAELAEFNRIAELWNDATLARDREHAALLQNELDNFGSFGPLYIHSINEGAKPVLLYHQIICDLATVVEIAERMIAALNGQDDCEAVERGKT